MATPDNSQSTQDALTFAYQYGYPLYAYGLYVKAFTNPQANVVYPFRHLATPEDRAVVRPNVDTLYTPLFYDLSQSDLAFEIPEFDDRYWLWPWYDMYGNNFANIGSLQGFKAGRYLLRFTDDNFGVHTEGVEDGYLAHVNSPTPYGLLLNRILVKDGTPEDLEKVHALQDQMVFEPRAREDAGTRGAPALDLSLFEPLMDDSTNEALGRSVLKLTAALSRYNPPEVVDDRPWVATTLRQVGINNDTFVQPDGTDLSAAVSKAHTTATESRKPAGLSEDLGNNWAQPAAQISGDFKSFYAARMFSAHRGYLILTRDQAAYPGYTGGAVSGSDRFSITKDDAYLLTFPSGRPRLKDTGFWSLTIYGADQYLIPNELGRYNLGDRSGLRYSDGSPLASADGEEFGILIQAADVRPPIEWIENWLPGPAGGGTFMTSFRFYGAQPSMTDGTWEYPIVTKVKAIVEQ